MLYKDTDGKGIIGCQVYKGMHNAYSFCQEYLNGQDLDISKIESVQ